MYGEVGAPLRRAPRTPRRRDAKRWGCRAPRRRDAGRRGSALPCGRLARRRVGGMWGGENRRPVRRAHQAPRRRDVVRWGSAPRTAGPPSAASAGRRTVGFGALVRRGRGSAADGLRSVVAAGARPPVRGTPEPRRPPITAGGGWGGLPYSLQRPKRGTRQPAAPRETPRLPAVPQETHPTARSAQETPRLTAAPQRDAETAPSAPGDAETDCGASRDAPWRPAAPGDARGCLQPPRGGRGGLACGARGALQGSRSGASRRRRRRPRGRRGRRAGLRSCRLWRGRGVRRRPGTGRGR